MQQRYLLSELEEHIAQLEGNAPDFSTEIQSTRTAWQFLSACNHLFEEGLLSHHKIFSVDNDIFTNMATAFRFFVEWYDERLSKGIAKHSSYVNIQVTMFHR